MNERLTLSEKVLMAAIKLCANNYDQNFTAEQLLVVAWKSDPLTFGLRGFENEYPDSNKIYTKLDGKGA